jgi:hypothetical protein
VQTIAAELSAIRRRPNDELLRSLTCGIARPMEARVAMLQVYLDDTSNGECLIAGLMASVASWDQLSVEWNEIVGRDPRLTHWHQSDAYAARKEPWASIAREGSYQRFVESFTEAIKNARCWGVAVSLKAEEWKSAIERSKPIKKLSREEGDSIRKFRAAQKHYASPYSILGASVAQALIMRLDEVAPSEKLMVIFEASEPAKDESNESVMRWMINRAGMRDRFHSIGIAPGKRGSVRQLEAADLFAWSYRNAKAGHRGPWDTLQQSMSVMDLELTPEIMRKWLDKLPHDD